MNKIPIKKEFFDLFDISMDEVPDFRPAPMHIIERRFKRLKRLVKRRYRKKVMECHPDRGGDPAQFRKIQEAFEWFDKTVKITRTIQRPPQTVIIRYRTGASWTDATTSSSTTGGYTYTSW
jgi:hypothetical protein